MREGPETVAPVIVEPVIGGGGVIVTDDPANAAYPMPIDVSGRDEVFVGRVRQDVSHPNGIAMWVVSDNLRKGAATNAIQIAEDIVRRGAWLRERV